MTTIAAASATRSGAATAMADARRRRRAPRRRRARPCSRRLRDHGVYVAIAVAAGLQPARSPRNFATVANLRLQLVQVVPVAIVALGMALVVATEGIDLSVGSSWRIAAALHPAVPRLRRLAGDRDRACSSARWSAWSTARSWRSSASSRSSPRSACWSPAAALALVLADGRLVEIFDPTLGALGNGAVARRPDHACSSLAVAAALVVGVVVRRSAFGRRLVAIGGNRDRGRPGRPAGPAHAARRLRDLRGARRRRRRAQHGPARAPATRRSSGC